MKVLSGHRLLKIAFALSVVILLTGLMCCFPMRRRGPLAVVGPPLPGVPIVRVAIYEENPAAPLTVCVDSPYEVRTISLEKTLQRGSFLQNESLYLDENGFRLGSEALSQPSFCLLPLKDGTCVLNSCPYRGRLYFYRQGSQGMVVVNELDLETYLVGVLAAEMPLSFPEEALKAQVIAARTYALYRVVTGQDTRYDVKSDVSSQVYRGSDSEGARVRELVQATRGMVLTYDWHLFPTYYHSTCAGHTTSPATVWGGETVLPLSGGRCGYCTDSPYAHWEVRLSGQEVLTALAAEGITLDEVVAIHPDKDDAGYARTVRIVGGGETVGVEATRLRQALGWQKLPSTAFSVKKRGDEFIFRGRGFGHGVGLCQWGAQGLAEAGADASRVLVFYYPGSRLVKLAY